MTTMLKIPVLVWSRKATGERTGLPNLLEKERYGMDGKSMLEFQITEKT